MEGPVDVVLDVGANIGAAAVLFRERWPAAAIYAFEPDPTNFALLEQNVASLQVTCLPFGLSSQDETVDLFIGNDDRCTNSINRSRLNGAASIRVPVRDARAACDALGISQID